MPSVNSHSKSLNGREMGYTTMQFARNVQFQIRSGQDQEFTRLLNAQVLPMLRKHTGFRNEVALLNGQRAIGISLWENEAAAREYASTTYPEVLKALAPVIEGTPKVETYAVAAATMPVAATA